MSPDEDDRTQTERLAQFIQKTLDAAPPLTEAQITLLARLLRGGEQVA